MVKAAPKFPPVGSVEVETERKQGETPTRRLAITKDRLVTQPMAGIDTVYDIIQNSARSYGTKNALGTREVLDIHEEEKEVKKMVDGKEVTEKKTWKYFELSAYKYLSFVEVKEIVDEIAQGLVQLGVGKGEVFNIYAQTRYVTLFGVTIHFSPARKKTLVANYIFSISKTAQTGRSWRTVAPL